MKVIIKSKECVFDEFFKVDRAVIQYEKFDGTMTKDVIRFNFDRGNSVGILLVNPQKQSIILTKQFRYPAYVADEKDGWVLEIVAGMVEPGVEILEAAKHELLEEVGYAVDRLEPIHVFYPSPGGTSEKVYLYYAEANEAQKTAKGGGLAGEGEDIQIVELPIDEVFRLLDAGHIRDAKTIIALQWLRQKRNKEREIISKKN